MTSAPAEPRSPLDRFLSLVPVAVAALVLLGIVLWQAALRKSPTIFTDELEWTQMSRAIAATGHAARRGEPIGLKSLYEILIAPSWWLGSTASGYAAVRYVNGIVMAAAAIPVFLLARMLVSTRAATIAALGTLCTTAFYYAPLILPEVLAYPVFALCAWVAVRALAGGGRRWTIAAIALSALAVAVRTELVVVGASLAIAAAVLWVCGPRGRRLRANWSVVDHIGAALLLLGALILVNRLASPHAQEWAVATGYWQQRVWNLGFEAASAFCIGIGVLPAVAALGSFWLPERRHDPAWRAFAAFFAASIVTVGTYTGVKAAYLSTVFATRVEERNLIYLGPLVLVGTVTYFSSRRPWLPGVAAGAAFVGYLALAYGYQLDYPYFEAPGYGIAVMANRSFAWTQHDIRLGLAGVFAISLAVMAVAFVDRRRSVRTGILGVTALATATLMLAGVVTSARGSQHQAKIFLANFKSPPNFIDLVTRGQGVTYLGQNLLGDDTGIWLLEFWNRSIRHVYSLDGTAPGPGPSVTPDLAAPNGRLRADPGLPYVLTDNGVHMIGKVVTRWKGLALTRLRSHPWRLKEAVYGLSGDGWTGSDARYAYFGPERSPGILSVDVGRVAFCVKTAPNAHVLVRVGPVALDRQRQPFVRRVSAVRTVVVPNCTERTLRFRVRPPVAVKLDVSHLVRPADYGGSDARELGVQAGFSFKSSR